MQMINIKNIDWDLDGLNPHECGVPTNIILPAKEIFSKEIPEEEWEAAADEIVDYLSDKYEYCIKSCNISFFYDYKRRCQDCAPLFTDDDGDWACNKVGRKYKEIDRCPEGL